MCVIIDVGDGYGVLFFQTRTMRACVYSRELQILVDVLSQPVLSCCVRCVLWSFCRRGCRLEPSNVVGGHFRWYRIYVHRLMSTNMFWYVRSSFRRVFLNGGAAKCCTGRSATSDGLFLEVRHPPQNVVVLIRIYHRPVSLSSTGVGGTKRTKLNLNSMPGTGF